MDCIQTEENRITVESLKQHDEAFELCAGEGDKCEEPTRTIADITNL